ncbi:class I SAM-dependent methyltransferase [Patescibacteria group bacterium]|nr:class I SAM-dependent methyltransferase [Patescibacteria group bacterium]
MIKSLAEHRKALQVEYARLCDHAKSANLSKYYVEQTTRWATGGWKMYLDFVVLHLPVSPRGMVVMDYGCGAGMLSVILFELGAAKYVGVDVLPQLAEISALHDKNWDLMTIVSVDHGYIAAQPTSIDIVIANEVISHVNPRDLPTVYQEWGRIVRPGGCVFISDGNNHNDKVYTSGQLADLYDAIENGPDGRPFGNPPSNPVIRCYYNARRALIGKQWFPGVFTSSEVDDLARNTAGMWGHHIRREVQRYIDTGVLIKRPWRPGQAPMVPTNGVVQERTFYPEQVALSLQAEGFTAYAKTTNTRRPPAWSGDTTPWSYPTSNFQIVAIKN